MEPTTPTLEEELERERRRALEAAADARNAERDALLAQRSLREVRQQLKVERARIRTIRDRRSVRIADKIARFVRRVSGGLTKVRRTIRPPGPQAGAGAELMARALDRVDDARSLPARYRATLLAALHHPEGGADPLRVVVLAPIDGPERAHAVAARDALRERGHEISIHGPVDAGSAPLAIADVIVAAGDVVDPILLPSSAIRVHLGDGAADPLRSEWDVEVAGHDGLVAALDEWLRARRISIRTPSGSAKTASTWGDTYFARDLRAALRAAGRPTRIHLHDRWDDPAVGRDDVVIDLLGTYPPTSQVGGCRVLWQISHPELADPALYSAYDLVFVASDRFARLMADRSETSVRPLHQATDPARFHPDRDGPPHELLFVGNWRPGRRILEDLLPTEHGLAVYGNGWTEDRLDPRYHAGDWIRNEELAGYYAHASVLLNDHAAGMRREGFLSNRLYDAAASGAFIVSDEVDGLGSEFDGGVVAYRDRADLRALIDRHLADPGLRRAAVDRSLGAVLERHTFGQRVRSLLEAIDPIAGDPDTTSAA